MVGGFVVPALSLSQFRLRGDQLTLAGRLEDAGPVALQVGLDTLQRSYGGVKARELLFDLGDDAVLFGEGWKT